MAPEASITTTIRRARPTDAEAIAALVRDVGYPAYADAVAATLARFAAQPDCIVAVAEEAGDVVGVVAITASPSLRVQGTIGRVSELAVRAGAHRRGIGERLLLYAKGVATERGFARLEVAVPDHVADHFLLHRGFGGAGEHLYRWAQLESKHPPLPASPRQRWRRRLA